MHRTDYSIGSLFLITLLAAAPAFGTKPLDPYLLRSEEIPASCRSAPGLYPIHEKVAIFYEYKVYQIILPPVLERYAQSFDCGGQNGTLYFFAYAQADDADAAELFARPVLTRLTPAPVIRSFPKGFVIVSFKDPPPALLEALNKKIRPDSAKATVSIQKSTGSVMALPIRPPVVSSVSVVMAPPPVTASSAPAVAVSSTMAPSPPSADASLPIAGPDLSGTTLSTIMTELGCERKDAAVETREVCQCIQAFQSGTVVDPVLAVNEIRVGVAYHINSFGELDQKYYDVLVGSGRPGEIALFSIHPANGLEDNEAQTLTESHRAGHPFPSTNGLGSRIINHGRPQHPMLFPTEGRSHVMKFAGDKQIFIRGAGFQWILISVTGKSPPQQTRSDVVIAALY